jgi:hypothetical protein
MMMMMRKNAKSTKQITRLFGATNAKTPHPNKFLMQIEDDKAIAQTSITQSFKPDVAIFQ